MSILQSNKKLTAGLGIAAVVVAVAAIGAGTYAAFSDTETGPGGTLTAGTLDLEVGGGAEQVAVFSESNLVPGKIIPQKTITVANAGTVPGTLSGAITVTGEDVTCTEPEREAEGVKTTCAPGGNLQEQLNVIVKGPNLPSNGLLLPLPLVDGAAFPATVPLAPKGTATYTFDFSLPNLSGTENNKVQGDKLTISTTLNLVQSTP